MNDKIIEFLKLKKCSEYKIDDEDIVCNSYPENYCFIRKEGSKWIYGENHRGKEKRVKEFKMKEEALLCLVYNLYTIKKSIELKKGYVVIWSQMSNEDLIKETDLLFETSLLKQLEILNEEQLIYKEKYIIDNTFSKRTIEDFRLFKLFSLKAFEQTRNELIKFGVDPLELDNNFRFENLVDL